MACVALGKPFLYVESNTDKITNLCHDVGLPCELLNVTREIDRGEFAALEARLGVVANSFGQYADKLERFCNDGERALASLFQTLLATSRVVTSAAPQLDPHE